MPFFDQPGQLKQISTVTPGQEQLVNQAGRGGLDLLKQLQGQQFNFDPIAQQARTQFQTKTIPSIAERFTRMGDNAGSSALLASLGSAGSGLEQALAAMKSQYGLQERGLNQQLLQQLLGVGLHPTQSHYFDQGEQGYGGQLLSMLAQAALAAGTGGAAGVPGAISSGIGLFGNLFGGKNKQQTSSQPFTLGGMGGTGFNQQQLGSNLMDLTKPFGQSPQFAPLYGGF